MPGHDAGMAAYRPSFSPGGGLYLGVSPGIANMRLKRPLTAALLAAIALAGIAVASAQERRVPNAAELRLSYAPVVQRVAPAVVNVYAAKVIQNRNPLFDDPIFRRFFGVPGDGGGRQIQRSLGSGVIVDPSGLIVTNVHVIEGADEVKVALADKREFEAEIVLKDKRSDLAVLRIKDAHERFPVLEFANSDALEVGDVVLAIGDPFGVGQTVTHGIVSALARTQVGITDYQFFIQTDAAINPGNSGGALVDLTGRLVGINTAIFSRSGGSQGIGFAIPANMVRVVVASAKGGSSAVQRPWLGAKLQQVTADIADSMGLKRPAGALVASVARGGPAEHAGLKAGDVIVSVDAQAGRRRQRLRLSLRHQAARRHGHARPVARRPRAERESGAADRAGNAARRDHHPLALAVLRRQGRQSFAGACRRAAIAECRRGRRRSWTSTTAPMPAISVSGAATSSCR